MSYTANNPILYNAVIAAVAAAASAGTGMFDSSPQTNTTDANIEAVDLALEIAQAVDTGIAPDPTITSGGATLVPTTGTIQNAQISKSSAIGLVAYAAFEDIASSPAPISVNVIAASIIALYTSIINAPFSLL